MAVRRIREEREDSGVTHVVEFIMSFLIFLVIMLAYFTATRSNLAPYSPEQDYLPSQVIEIAEVFLDNPGRFGNNSTTWENRSASEVEANMTGLGLARDNASYAVLSEAKIFALGNLTYAKLTDLLNLRVLENINLTIKTTGASGVNLTLGFGFENQNTVVTALRHVTIVNETSSYEAVFELKLFEGGVFPIDLRINEISYRGFSNVTPIYEWLEFFNPSAMAINLSVYNLDTGSTYASIDYYTGAAILGSGMYAVVATAFVSWPWPVTMNSSALNVTSGVMLADSFPDTGNGTIVLLFASSVVGTTTYDVTALGNPVNPIFYNVTSGGWNESALPGGTPGWLNL